jgi:hypothetical protein
MRTFSLLSWWRHLISRQRGLPIEGDGEIGQKAHPLLESLMVEANLERVRAARLKIEDSGVHYCLQFRRYRWIGGRARPSQAGKLANTKTMRE